MYLSAHINNELVIRPYTPVTSNDEIGYFDLVIKVSLSPDTQPLSPPTSPPPDLRCTRQGVTHAIQKVVRCPNILIHSTLVILSMYVDLKERSTTLVKVSKENRNMMNVVHYYCSSHHKDIFVSS